ncbi:MAG: prolipoprotein diacylglyceryl transferase [Anaerolineae bacterium]|nr:prolipoprotein diacylglyceryl transferase [Anaerolineae bacterium]
MTNGFWGLPGYTLRIGVGIVTGLLWLWFAASHDHFSHRQLAVLCWSIGLCALLCGRVGYILMNGEYFWQNPAHILQLHRIGGVNGESALLGGLIGLTIWTLAENWRQDSALDFDNALSLFTPAALFVIAGAWWACQHTGCSWGQAAPSDTRWQWLRVTSPDLYRSILPRYPVQLMGGVWAMLLGVGSAIRWLHGKRASWGLVFYCLGAAAISQLRGDDVPTFGQLRIDTLGNMGIALAVSTWQWIHPRLEIGVEKTEHRH